MTDNADSTNTYQVICEHVSKRYGGGKRSRDVVAVDDLSLTVNTGEFVAIMGPSGSGKTTLLHLLAGLLKPDRGTLVVAGTNLRMARESKLAMHRRERIGLVFQSFNLLPRLTVSENVELPLLLSGKEVPHEKATEALTELGLAGRSTHYPSELSGGEQQRVAFARAMLHRPRLLLADEPTGNLDSQNALILSRMLTKFAANGQTIVLTTHNHEVARIADRTVLMRDGRIVV